MQSFIVELRVSPPAERPHLQGVLVQITIRHSAGAIGAEVRARPCQAMDWMEPERESGLIGQEPHPVESMQARALLGRILTISLPLISPSTPGIHETAYRLRVFSGASFCEFNWWHKLPAEWQALEGIVTEIQAIAGKVFNNGEHINP